MSAPVILLTGAAGGVGGAMALRLALAGVELHLLQHRRAVSAPPGAVIHQGDLTRENLGLDSRSIAPLHRRLNGILHCGGLTEFSVSRARADRVNVLGTENLLRFARQCRRIDRIGLLSTVYVAGRRRGTIAEQELKHRAGFVNEYERSKYQMELRASRFHDLPLAVYRLSTILGREGGEVVRWGAVHHALRLFFHGWIPMVPGESESTVDLISFDYATSAVEELFVRRFEPGTFHLAAGKSSSLNLEDFLGLSAMVFRAEHRQWSRRGIEPPPVVSLRTFRRLEQAVGETGDVFLGGVLRSMSRFVPQLAYPKTFRIDSTLERLQGTGIAPSPLAHWLPAVLRYCLRTQWGSKAEAKLAEAL